MTHDGNDMPPQQSVLESAYKAKPETYFGNARHDYVELMPQDPSAAILELGCGSGANGKLALDLGKCATYCGIEINDEAARAAMEKLSQVIVGNVEETALPWPPDTFDVLIMSEVLEHLVDPWTVVRRLIPLVKAGGLVLASSPNVSHHKVIRSLLNGRWELTEKGVMDWTHLRWFTPAGFRSMFEDAGVQVLRLEPVRPFGRKARIFNALTMGKFKHLSMSQMSMIGTKS